MVFCLHSIRERVSMKIINVFSTIFVVAAASALLLCGGPARADTIFQLDNGVANNVEENNINGQMMWDSTTRPPAASPIRSVSLAWAC